MDEKLRERVRARASHRCEYCRLPEDSRFMPTFHVDHIISRKHGGTDDLANLALACLHCNLHKGPNLAGIDPQTGVDSRLYHPRTQSWHQQFVAHALTVNGRTAEGRTTVRVLNMNTIMRRRLRSSLRRKGHQWP